MKKMQCEVCGSTTIKKTGESTFECQSCGVQYSKEEVQKLLVEVTGTVKIDRSEEVDNTIKRAEQFYEQGDTEKAEEYYNKALDIDPDNLTANAGVKKINDNENVYSYAALKQTISAQDGINKFLNSLKNQTDIVPDIYKEIEIISSHEAYYPISIYNGKYTGQYSGTACYRKEVPYTDYEEKRERLSNGTYVTRQVPVTKYRTEIDRKPVNGFYEADADNCYLMSDYLYEVFEPSKKVEFSINNPNHEYVIKEKYNEGLTSKLEYFCASKLSKLTDNLIDITSNDFKYNDGCAFYNGTKVDFAESVKTKKRTNDLFKKEIESSCENVVDRRIPGDFSESVKFNYNEESLSISNIFLPIQIIEYAYRGEFYMSALVLNEKADAISMTYPLYRSLDVTEKEDEIGKLVSKKTELTPIFAIGVLAGIGTLFFSIFGGFFFNAALCLLIGCVVALIISAVNNSKLNKQINEINEQRNNELANINFKHNKILNETSLAFFKEYNSNQSIESARNSASKSNDYSVDIDEVFIFGSEFSSLKQAKRASKGTAHQNTVQSIPKSDNSLVFTIKSIGPNKIQVLAALREALNLGLAEAKNIAESVPTQIYYKDLATARIGNKKLIDAGCVIDNCTTQSDEAITVNVEMTGVPEKRV